MSPEAAAVLALIVSFLGTRAALALARRRRVIAVPNERSSHASPTPSAGGLGIAAGGVIGLPAALCAGPEAAAAWAAASLALVGWVGFRDDVRPLPPLVKMLSLLVASGVLMLIAQLDAVALPFAGRLEFGVLALPLTLFWLAGFTNAFNFMDGIDGIAALTALVSGAAFAAVGYGHGEATLTALGLVTAAAATGFLPWNFPRAKLFMGDTGSLPLGLLLAFSGVYASQSGALSFPACVLLLGPFVFDSAFTLVRRLARGVRVWEAHREHLYQRLSRRIGAHAPVSLLYAGLSCVTAVLALTYDGASETARALCLGLPLAGMLAFAAIVLRCEGAGEGTSGGPAQGASRSDV